MTDQELACSTWRNCKSKVQCLRSLIFRRIVVYGNLAHPLSHVDSDGVGRARVVEEDGRGVDARSDVRQRNAFAGLHLLLVHLEFVSKNPTESR